MSGVGGIRAGRAFVEIGGDDSQLRAVLRKAEQRLNAAAKTIQGIGQKMAAVGGTIAGGLFATAVSAGKLGDHLNDLKAKTGIGAEALAGLDLAATSSGSSLDALAAGINKMQRTMNDAATGSKSAQQAMANLGLTISDLQGLKPEEQFSLIADRIAAITDPTKRTAAAVGIFGRSGADLLPVLTLGAKGLRDFQAQADSLGITLAFKTAQGVGEFDDALARTRKQIEAVKVTIGAAIASALLPYQDSIAQALKRTIEWASANGELIVSTGKAAAKVAAAGVALMGMSQALNVVAKSIRVVSVAIKLLNANPLVAVATVLATVATSLILYEKLIAAENMKVAISMDGYTKASDESRASDIERLAGLKKLSEAGKLNDIQMGEARGLISQLEMNYGALGLTIDKTTGQIVGMADAWDKVTAAMGEAAKADIEKQLHALDEEFTRLEKSFSEINDDWWDGLARMDASDGNIQMGSGMQGPKNRQVKKTPKIIQDNIDSQNAVLEKRRELNRRLKEIDDRTVNALTGGAKPSDPTPVIAPIVATIEDVGEAAYEASDKVNLWTRSMQLAQQFMSSRQSGLDLLSGLDIDLARATGDDKLADQLEILREYEETIRAIRGMGGLNTEEMKVAADKARGIMDARLAQVRETLNRVSGFSAGVVNSNSIASLNRAARGGAPGVTELKKNVEQNQKIIALLQQIADSGGLTFAA